MTIHSRVRAIRYEYMMPKVENDLEAIVSGEAKIEKSLIGVLVLEVDLNTKPDKYGIDGVDGVILIELERAARRYLEESGEDEFVTDIRIVPFETRAAISSEDLVALNRRMMELECQAFPLKEGEINGLGEM